MTCGRPIRFTLGRPAPRRQHGFTIIELVIVLAIILVASAIATPMVLNMTRALKLQGAVAAVKAGIQSTRYQAIFQGCSYQIVFTAATGSYQVQGKPYSAAAGGCLAAMTNICSGLPSATPCPIPLSGMPNPVNLNSDIILVFKPGGSVSSPSFPGNAPISMTVTYPGLTPVQIQVSNYGNITP